MTVYSPDLIASIRKASRELVREHGFLKPTLAGTELSPSAVHTILEIGQEGYLTAKDLSRRLNLEKSTVSRMLLALEQRGEITKTRQETDARSHNLSLTPKGRDTFKAVTAYGETMVKSALPHLAGATAADLERLLSAYANALKEVRTGQTAKTQEKTIGGADSFKIVEGYQTGMIGDIAALHARTHGSVIGNGPTFESLVSKAMAEFVQRLASPLNNSWSVVVEGQIIGSVTIDGEDLSGNIAHLRWFILSERLRGKGLGRRLLDKALSHCDAHGFNEIHLWTVKGLDAARKLYEQNGFALVDEYDGDQWGKSITEQKFIRHRLS
ncbi:bifunctional helix-turn-helix transcriptional regulator/GNAT family N-acetyltransferase [Roseibium algae]|uniref:Helix-turn-helix domain-containing GNAT family N-acetyltransferase n=1 Tax=Roseibium algae TaxID=3123038 RepID=A0ABU8TR85_9HYPH